MKEEHRELVRTCQPRLIEAIVSSKCLDDLIDHLASRDQNGNYGLTSANIGQIRGGHHTDEAAKVRIFLEILTTRGENAFERFINAVSATNQIGLIEILNSELPQDLQIRDERSTLATSASAPAALFADTFNNQDNKGRMVGGPVHGGIVVQGDYYATGQTSPTSSPTSSQPSIEDWQQKFENIQSSLREIYMKSYRSVIPISSAQFFFDIKEKWVNLTLQVEDDSKITGDYADLLKKKFAEADMLIIEGDPGVGKSSLMHRLAYEWTQSQLCDYDLVIYIEFRKLREYEFKDIRELVSHYMKGYLDEEDHKILDHFINDAKFCKEHKVLVLLDGYDESSLEKQCQELCDYFNSAICRPLRFNVLLSSRKGYLSKFRNKGRFIFADIIGFTTESQKQEYISKHFNAVKDTVPSENKSAVTRLLNTNVNLKRLSELPLMLTFICLLHNKITDGTEVELYMNIIWWMIERYQRGNPDQDVPSFFEVDHNGSDKFRVIENSYQHFPQLHKLGTMAMQDIFKTTFTDADLKDFQLNEIVKEVGFLRKEVTRDTSNHTKVEYSFLHRSIQEFIIALTFFFSSEEPPKLFMYFIFLTATNKDYGIIPSKIQKYLDMIYSSKQKMIEKKKNLYSKYTQFYKEVYSNSSLQKQNKCIVKIHSQDDAIHFTGQKERSIPKSSEEAIQLLHDEAEKGDVFAQFILGIMYHYGLITIQSDKKSVEWYKKAAEQGHAGAQNNLASMCMNGKGMTQSDEEAVQWFKKSAEQGNAVAQMNLGNMYKNGKGVPHSYEEAVKWYTKSAEQENADASYNLGNMYKNGKGVPHSYEEAVKWYTKSAEQGNVDARYNLGNMYQNGQGVPRSNEEAVKWYTKSAEQGYAVAQLNLGFMFKKGKGTPHSYEETVKWYRKAAEQGNARAQYELGLMYEKGKGVTHSYEEAVKWFEKSAELGNERAQCKLGLICKHRPGIPQSNEETAKWYTKPAEQADTLGQNNLKITYSKEKGGQQSDEEEVKRCTYLAEQGDKGAQCELGNMYRDGEGVIQSDDEAVKWYTKSTEQGYAVAQINLGIMYLNGKGVLKSEEEAVKWFKKSAEQGNAAAQYNLGNMYKNGSGAPQSDAEAVKWYRKAAEQGIALSQDNLGWMYQMGKGVPQSDKEAIKWYKKAAEQGNAHAQEGLGWMYQMGKGVPQSDEEAVKWYIKSAEQGNADAQCKLELLLKMIEDMPQSDEEAIKSCRKSAEQENADAKFNQKEISKKGQGILKYLKRSKK